MGLLTTVSRASKAAVKSFTETLALEVKPLGVKTLLLAPGVVRTRIFSNCAGSTEARLWTPKEGSLYNNRTSKRYVKMMENSEKSGTELDVFIQKAVDLILRPNPPRYATVDGG